MTESRDRLEDVLAALRDRIDLPAGRDVSARVRAAIETGPPRRAVPWPLRPAVALPVVVVVGIALVLTLSVPARRAVAGWLGVIGIEISVEEGDGPAAEPSARLYLGDEMSLEQADARVDFPVRVPALLGAPDAVYFDPSVGRGQVSLLYGETSRAADRVLVTQFEAELDRALVRKLVYDGTALETADVAGSQAFWISGEPHVFYYVDSEGRPRQESLRLAANALIWERDGVTFRVECSCSQRRAVEIGASLF